ncbi:MAG: hypothetical protein J1F22_04085 [Lachnospiraceae bacterium]|nr:hypothetical protein [Lachnospiraceae bacterium]
MTEKKEQFFKKHLLDLANRAYQENYPVFTDFMTTKEYAILNKSKGQFSGVTAICFGGHEDCSRMMGGFFPEDFMEDSLSMFPIVCIRAQVRNDKYAQSLTHRDYLGAILNLGIERSMIGDIRLRDQAAFIFCKGDFVSFILDNFVMVKHTPIDCEILENAADIPPQEYEKIQRTVASLRLDNVVAAMIGSARKRAVELITQGSVVAGHEEHTSVSFSCKQDMIISIRGYGKYRLDIPPDSITKKGKQKINIYKYI